MIRKLLLIINSFLFLSSFSQNVVGLSSTKFGRYNLSTNTFSLMNNGCDTTWTTFGYSTFDQANGKYIYTKSGLGNSDTLILINALTGSLIAKHTFSAGHLYNPQYCQSNNKVYGQSSVGFGQFDLTTNTYSIVNPSICYLQTYNGLSTFDQLNNRYIYKNAGNGWPDTLIIVSIPAGNLISKITSPSGGLRNFEYCQSNNKVYGFTFAGFGELNLTNSTYSITNNQLHDNNVPEGSSTFDQATNKYFFVRTNFNSNPDTLITLSALTGGVLAKNTFPKGNLCNPEFFGLTIATIKENSKINPRLSIYPNPTNETAIISNLQNGDIIKIYDFNGKLIKTVIATSDSNISIANLVRGFYQVNVVGQNYTTNLKLVIN